jgi:hypothetical protein
MKRKHFSSWCIHAKRHDLTSKLLSVPIAANCCVDLGDLPVWLGNNHVAIRCRIAKKSCRKLPVSRYYCGVVSHCGESPTQSRRRGATDRGCVAAHASTEDAQAPRRNTRCCSSPFGFGQIATRAPAFCSDAFFCRNAIRLAGRRARYRCASRHCGRSMQAVRRGKARIATRNPDRGEDVTDPHKRRCRECFTAVVEKAPDCLMRDMQPRRFCPNDGRIESILDSTKSSVCD